MDARRRSLNVREAQEWNTPIATVIATLDSEVLSNFPNASIT